MRHFLLLSVVLVGCQTPVMDTREYKELQQQKESADKKIVELEKFVNSIREDVKSLEKRNENSTHEEQILQKSITKLETRIKNGISAYDKLLEKSKAQQTLIEADDATIEEMKKLLSYYENLKMGDILSKIDGPALEIGKKQFMASLSKPDGYKWIWNHTLPFCPRESLNRTQERILEKAFREQFAVINEQIIRPAYADAAKTGYSITYKLNGSVEVFYIELE